jgi:hypothetical protein
VHDLGARLIQYAHRDDQVDALGDRREVGRIQLACARSDVVAFLRYWTVIAFGIQRCVVGTVASISMPMASSAALQEAIAWTVPRWL